MFNRGCLKRRQAIYAGQPLIEYRKGLFDSCGGFNTPTLCVVTKGIKAECNHLMRTTYPDACVGVAD